MSMSGTSRDDGLGERLAAGDALFDDFYYQALDDLAQAVYYVTGAPDSVATPESVNPPTPSSMSVDNLTVDIYSDESSSVGALDDQNNAVNNLMFNPEPEVLVKKEKVEDEVVVDMVVDPQVDDSRGGGGGGIKRARKMSSNDAQKKKKMETMMPQVSSTTSMTQCVDAYLANARTLSNAGTLSNSLDNADYTAVPPPSSYLPNAGRRRRVSVSAPTYFANAQLLEGTYHTRANARFLADACAAAPSVVDSAAHPQSPPPSTSSEPMPDPEVVAVESSLTKAIANARLSAFGTLNRFGNAHSPPPTRPNKPMHGSKDSDANARTLTNAYTRRRTVSACAPNLANARSMENARRSSVSENGLSLSNAHSMEDAQSVANAHLLSNAHSLSNAQPLSNAHSYRPPINNEPMGPKRTIFRDLTNVTIPQENSQSPPPSSHSASPPSYSLPSPSPTPSPSPSPPSSLPVPVPSVPESSHRSTTKWSKRYKEPLLQCLYPDCSTGFFSAYYQNVVRHIRVAHFGLPPSIAQQERMGIVDHRNAAPFVSKITKRNTEQL